MSLNLNMESLVQVKLTADLNYSYVRKVFGIQNGELFLVPESGIPSNITCLVTLDCELWKDGVIHGFKSSRLKPGTNQIQLQAPSESEILVNLRSHGALNAETRIAEIKTDSRALQEFSLCSPAEAGDQTLTEKLCAARDVEKTTFNLKIHIAPEFVTRHFNDELEKSRSIMCLEVEVFGRPMLPEIFDFFSEEMKCGGNDVSFIGPRDGEAHLFLRIRGAATSRVSLGTLILSKVPEQRCALSFEGKSDRVDELLQRLIPTADDTGFIKTTVEMMPTSAVDELGSLDDPRAIDALIKIVQAKSLNWLVRQEAINFLASKKIFKTIATLIRVVENPDEDSEVRRRAASALACEYKDSQGVKAIRRALRNEESSRLRYSFIMCLKGGGWWHEKR